MFAIDAAGSSSPQTRSARPSGLQPPPVHAVRGDRGGLDQRGLPGRQRFRDREIMAFHKLFDQRVLRFMLDVVTPLGFHVLADASAKGG